MKKTTAIKWPTMFKEDTRPDIPITRESAIDNHWHGESVWIGGIPTHWTAVHKIHVLTVLGPKVFWKVTGKASLTYKDGQFYGTLTPFIPALIKAFHLDWIATNTWTRQLLASRRDMWKAVITGKITNPEMLAKAYSRKYFGGAFSYRNIRRHCQSCTPVGLSDLFYYTTNPDLALEKLLDDKVGDYSWMLRDIIDYCRRWNDKVNPLWSMKRLTEYHQHQIERRELQRLEAISPKPIALPYKTEGLELILDERTCYLESCVQHNCVHNCYWPKVKKGNYLLAKGTINGERITLGIVPSRFSPDISLRVEQVHTAFNNNPSADTRQFCYDWVDDHHDDLVTTMKAIRVDQTPELPAQPVDYDIDIPW